MPMAGGSFDGFLRCGRGSASALTSCWNLLSCAISSRCYSEQAHGVHASARASGCSGCFYRAGGQIGSAGPLQAAATIGLLPVDDFHRIARGHHRHASCRHSRILHDQPLSRPRKRSTIFRTRLFYTLPQTIVSGVKANDPQCPYPTRCPFRESALVDKVMRNYRRASSRGPASSHRS
jgi:hypothetical protein